MSKSLGALVDEYIVLKNKIRQKLEKKKCFGVGCNCVNDVGLISFTEGDCNEGRWVETFCLKCGGNMES